MEIANEVEIYKELKEEVAVLEAELARKKGSMVKMEEYFMESMKSSGMDSMKISGLRFTRTKRVVPAVTDYEAFSQYVKESGDLSLFTNSVRVERAREIWNAGESIPGVEQFTKHSLSVRAV